MHCSVDRGENHKRHTDAAHADHSAVSATEVEEGQARHTKVCVAVVCIYGLCYVVCVLPTDEVKANTIALVAIANDGQLLRTLAASMYSTFTNYKQDTCIYMVPCIVVAIGSGTGGGRLPSRSVARQASQVMHELWRGCCVKTVLLPQ